jgi:maltose O-acetyltransferase
MRCFERRCGMSARTSSCVRPSICEYGAISIGDRTFVNVDTVMLDVSAITVGAACQIATRVQLLTATHPIDPERRRIGW